MNEKGRAVSPAEMIYGDGAQRLHSVKVRVPWDGVNRPLTPVPGARDQEKTPEDIPTSTQRPHRTD